MRLKRCAFKEMLIGGSITRREEFAKKGKTTAAEIAYCGLGSENCTDYNRLGKKPHLADFGSRVVGHAEIRNQKERITKNIDYPITVEISLTPASGGLIQICNQRECIAQHVNRPV